MQPVNQEPTWSGTNADGSPSQQMYKPQPTHQLELSIGQNQVGAQVPCSRDFLPRKKYQKYQKHIAGLQLKLEMERVDINKTYCCGLALKLMQFNSCGLSNTNISYCVITNIFFWYYIK